MPQLRSQPDHRLSGFLLGPGPGLQPRLIPDVAAQGKCDHPPQPAPHSLRHTEAVRAQKGLLAGPCVCPCPSLTLQVSSRSGGWKSLTRAQFSGILTTD